MSRLKELRIKKGVTQQTVADFLQFSRVAYTNIENGKREPAFETIVKLADYFEVSTDYLLGKTNNPAEFTNMNEAVIKLQQELSKLDFDIEDEKELETILKFIDSNKDMLKMLMNKD